MFKSQDELAQRGFAPKEFILDGKIHRFDRQGHRNAWYIGWLHHSSRDGEQIEIIEFGDWKTGEKYQWSSKTKLTAEDRAVLNKKAKDAARLAEQERKEMQEQAAGRAKDIWERCTENGTSPYLSRKKIEKLYGARTEMAEGHRNIVVPMYNSEGELRGLQRIRHDGRKMFLEGQQVVGLHFKMDPHPELERSKVLVCEGYATAVTLMTQTDLPVAIAFNANNLSAVCEIIRRKSPGIEIVVCGDDDRSVQRNGEPWNPGKEAARAAAQKHHARAIFPEFRSPESNGTDFNDLLCEEGGAAVRRQVVGGVEPSENGIPDAPPEAAVSEHPIEALGCSEDGFVYLCRGEHARIVKMGATKHSKLGLLALAPLSYWEAMFPGKDDFEVNRAADWLMTQCRKRGTFRTEMIRGAGAWPSREGLVLNLGSEVRGKTPEDDSVYVSADRLHLDTERHVTEAEARDFMRLVSRLNFKDQNRSCALFLGWLTIAPLGGALAWRPHLWITSEQGGGKSTIVNDIIQPLFGSWAPRVIIGWASSEAGIRQHTNLQSLPMLIDEPETDSERTSEKVADIVRLARVASFTSPRGLILKGTADQMGQSYRSSSCFAMASIRVNLQGEADRKRFVILELDDSKNSQAQWESLEPKFQEVLTPAFSARWVGRTAALWEVLRENIRVFRKVLGRLATSRETQQYSPLLGGFHLSLSDKPVDEAAAEAIITALGITESITETREPEAMDCLTHLLDAMVPTTSMSDQRSIRSLVLPGPDAPPITLQDSDRWLQEMGIRCNEPGHLCIRTKHTALRRIFRGTPWHDTYPQVLTRLPGAETAHRAYFGSQRLRCVRVSLSGI